MFRFTTHTLTTHMTEHPKTQRITVSTSARISSRLTLHFDRARTEPRKHYLDIRSQAGRNASRKRSVVALHRVTNGRKTSSHTQISHAPCVDRSKMRRKTQSKTYLRHFHLVTPRPLSLHTLNQNNTRLCTTVGPRDPPYKNVKIHLCFAATTTRG